MSQSSGGFGQPPWGSGGPEAPSPQPGWGGGHGSGGGGGFDGSGGFGGSSGPGGFGGPPAQPGGAWDPSEAIAFGWQRVKADFGSIVGAMFVAGLITGFFSWVG